MSEFPPHKHEGDQYSPHLCVWTREDGESCQFPLNEEGLAVRMRWAIDSGRAQERRDIGTWLEKQQKTARYARRGHHPETLMQTQAAAFGWAAFMVLEGRAR